MKYYVNFQNTGYIEDSILRIEPDNGIDGTEIRIEKCDENGNLVASAIVDVETIFKNNTIPVFKKEVKR